MSRAPRLWLLLGLALVCLVLLTGSLSSSSAAIAADVDLREDGEAEHAADGDEDLELADEGQADDYDDAYDSVVGDDEASEDDADEIEADEDEDEDEVEVDEDHEVISEGDSYEDDQEDGEAENRGEFDGVDLEAIAEDVFLIADTNRDGVLTLKEWMTLARHAGRTSKEEQDRANLEFRKWDADSDGQVTKDDLVWAYRQARNAPGDEDDAMPRDEL